MTLTHARCGGTLTLETQPLGWRRAPYQNGRWPLGIQPSRDLIEVARCDRCRLVGIPVDRDK